MPIAVAQRLERHEIAHLPLAWSEGDENALNDLIPLVYKELSRLAKSCMRRERPGHTRQTTALANEAYLRLVDARNVRWQSRAHFFAVAARLVRQILVDFTRSHRSAKHGKGLGAETLQEALAVTPQHATDLVAF